MNVLSSSHRQNENLIHNGNQLKSIGSRRNNNDTVFSGKKPMKTLSKTPSGKMVSTRRRAFGDISNKKTKNDFGYNSSSSIKTKPQKIEFSKPRSNSLLPRASRNVPTPQKTRIAILPVQSKPSSLGGRHNKVIGNVSQIIERSSVSKNQNSLSLKSLERKGCPPSKLEPYPDIEGPAGRTWKQQLEYDLEDEEDIASISSIESLLNAKRCISPEDCYRNEMNFRSMRQKKDYEEDRAVQEQSLALTDRERHEVEDGIDSFYGDLDNLRIFSDSSHLSESGDSQGGDDTVLDISGLDLDLSNDLSFPL